MMKIPLFFFFKDSSFTMDGLPRNTEGLWIIPCHRFSGWDSRYLQFSGLFPPVARIEAHFRIIPGKGIHLFAKRGKSHNKDQSGIMKSLM